MNNISKIGIAIAAPLAVAGLGAGGAAIAVHSSPSHEDEFRDRLQFRTTAGLASMVLGGIALATPISGAARGVASLSVFGGGAITLAGLGGTLGLDLATD